MDETPWRCAAGYDLHGAAYVVNNQLGMTHIWDRVRVMGGAYGGFCSFDSHSGLFQYLSYRCASPAAAGPRHGLATAPNCWGKHLENR